MLGEGEITERLSKWHQETRSSPSPSHPVSPNVRGVNDLITYVSCCCLLLFLSLFVAAWLSLLSSMLLCRCCLPLWFVAVFCRCCPSLLFVAVVYCSRRSPDRPPGWMLVKVVKGTLCETPSLGISSCFTDCLLFSSRSDRAVLRCS